MKDKIIIKDANFSQNGIKEQGYIDFTVDNGRASGTQQGYVLFDDGTYVGRNRLSGKGTNYHNNWIKSTKAIVVHPGDSIVVMNMAGSLGYMCIFAYRSAIINTVTWPTYTPLDGNNQQWITISYGSGHYAKAAYTSGSKVPLVVRNTAAYDMCIVIQGRKTSGSVTPTEVPYMEYRIYTDNPEAYEEDIEEPEEEESEPETT